MRTRGSIEDAAKAARINASQTKIPVDPAIVAAHLGCSVVKRDFTDDLSGVLVRGEGATTIAVNSTHSLVRQRFTIAHECGHLALAHQGEVFIDRMTVNRRDATSSLAIDDREIEANQFAASLLMPREEVVTVLNDLLRLNPSREVIVDQMASKFRVSRQSMNIRLVNLGLLSPAEDEF